MSPETFDSILQGAQETDAIEFKAAIAWERNTFVKDILALANVRDGGFIIVGVEDGTFAKHGLTDDQVASFDIDIMRDQISPFADPRVVFTRQVLVDAALTFVIIEVSPFDDVPVVCARDGADVQAGAIYFRSRSRRPASARVARSEDMREIIEASIARRARGLKRAGFVPAVPDEHDFDTELGGL